QDTPYLSDRADALAGAGPHLLRGGSCDVQSRGAPNTAMSCRTFAQAARAGVLFGDPLQRDCMAARIHIRAGRDVCAAQ
ncbi:MAG TPA: hypothetical protein VGP15_05710, partial [Burkholderiales bacterium]|nr:hypothetical protein [Burkholderiales bacterium]